MVAPSAGTVNTLTNGVIPLDAGICGCYVLLENLQAVAVLSMQLGDGDKNRFDLKGATDA